MSWDDRIQVKKGNIGERIVIDYLLKKGVVPYKPVLGSGAHPFDQLCATKDKRRVFVTECKAKPARTYYPDTGIDIRHYKDYKNIQNKYNMDVFIFFIDEDAQEIYGGKISKLSQKTVVHHNNKKIEYPLKQKGIIYFPLSLMTKIADISNADANRLRKHSTRNSSYARGRK